MDRAELLRLIDDMATLRAANNTPERAKAMLAASGYLTLDGFLAEHYRYRVTMTAEGRKAFPNGPKNGTVVGADRTAGGVLQVIADGETTARSWNRVYWARQG